MHTEKKKAAGEYNQQTYCNQIVKVIKTVPQLQQAIQMNGKRLMFEVDIGAGEIYFEEDFSRCTIGSAPGYSS